MPVNQIKISIDKLTPFDTNFINSPKKISYIGSGSIGGKASGLAFIEDAITSHFKEQTSLNISVGIPRFVVITTDIFDQFMEDNDLHQAAFSDMSDEYIAQAFGKGKLPDKLMESLRTLIDSIQVPLAIRSSSLLEDALYEPFAGVYVTKMIPNNHPDADTRFERLVKAIKFVYASTFFKAAKDYHRAIGRSTEEEKMAVIIQEVVGQLHNDRFYPHISGVARSYNFYPMGSAKPEDGVVNLALGLGKTIVDGGLVWSYSPAYPRTNPPVSSPGELLRLTQTDFWAVNMGKPPVSNLISETEYMSHLSLSDSEQDGTLRFVASTYRPQDDRIVMGTGSSGPRVVTFAPILIADQIPLNNLLTDLLKICEKTLGNKIEIEFAVLLDTNKEPSNQFGFLQVRPLVVSDSIIDLAPEEMLGENALIASEKALGNGIVESIKDIIYVDPDSFNAKDTQQIAGELAEINRQMVDEGRPYLLIGFGRWGSSDPWLGIPVNWGQISGARVVVEATLPGMDVELSQGAHFFHNMTSFQICYLAVHHAGKYSIKWDWLKDQKTTSKTMFVRHIQLSKPLTVKVDGRSGRGVILT